jgi:HlyD family secretion protein
MVRPVWALGVLVVLAAGAMWQVRGGRSRGAVADVTTQAVARHDVALMIEASGTIEPVDLVEVKSKASGTITQMPVSVGSRVRSGDLMVQIDTRDVKNQFDQAQASLDAASAKVQVSKDQKTRADELFARGVLTADEHDAAQLDDVNSRAGLVSARANLDLAKQRLDDATVRAPIEGTVLSQPVTAGQVIASATSSVNGGTALLTMADLRRIRMRAMVAETDLGQVQPGQHATVTVDAFPDRTFEGTVEKIEPQAVVEQSVTNFPVLVSLANEDERLLPGMNGEVSLVVDRRSDVVAVPADAVRSLREAMVIAPSLGLDADSLRAQLTRTLPGGGAGRWRASGDSRGDSRGDSASAGRGRGRAQGDSAVADRGRGRAGADSSAAGHGRHRWGGGMGRGVQGGGGGAGSDAATTSTGASGSRANRAQVVFVKTANGIEPRLVRLGLSDFDWSEVLAGVHEGDQVVMLGITQAQASRNQQQSQIRQRVGTMPGGIGGGAPGGAGSGGGGGGGRRGAN